MRRREFIAGLGSVAAWPLAASAQQPSQMRRIGVFSTLAGDDPDSRSQIEAFLQGLAQLGWTDGRNVWIDYRWGSGRNADISKSATELANLAPDVILPMAARSW